MFRFEAYQSRGSDDEEDEERPFGGQVFVHGKDDPLGKCANQFTKIAKPNRATTTFEMKKNISWEKRHSFKVLPNQTWPLVALRDWAGSIVGVLDEPYLS